MSELPNCCISCGQKFGEIERLTAENTGLRESLNRRGKSVLQDVPVIRDLIEAANVVVARYAEATHSIGDFARLEDALNTFSGKQGPNDE